jgi:hypothetical protein
VNTFIQAEPVTSSRRLHIYTGMIVLAAIYTAGVFAVRYFLL